MFGPQNVVFFNHIRNEKLYFCKHTEGPGRLYHNEVSSSLSAKIVIEYSKHNCYDFENL